MKVLAKKYRILWKPGKERTVALVERLKRLGRNTIQNAWPEFPSGEILKQVVGIHDVETGEVIADWDESGASINVSNVWLASLDESQAAALDLPPSTKLGLDLRSSGLPSESEFRIRRTFKTAAGIEVSREVVGAFVQNNERIERLPQPMFDIELASSALRIPVENQAERLKRLEGLTLKLENAGINVSADGFLESLRVFYAGGISLSLKINAEEFDFDPILFSRPNEIDVGDELLDETEDSLLPKVLQEEFLKEFEKRGKHMRASALGNGAFVYMDPFVAKALQLIAEKKAAPREDRRQFALSPRRAFKEAFAENESDEKAIDRLFIETDQFSKRVSSIDVWRPPVLPWIKPRPNSWLPEEFGFKVGDQVVRLTPEGACELANKIEAAIEEGRADVEYDGMLIEASARSRDAARDLAEIGSIIKEYDADPKAPVPKNNVLKKIKRFLIVNENFETVTYDLSTSELAKPQIKIDPPATLKSTFKRHQLVGFEWLALSQHHENRGVLLADDMGLGKTLQALAFIQWHKERSKVSVGVIKPTLIVAPTSLQDNWLGEMATHFSPEAFANVRKVTGTFLKSIRSPSSDASTDAGVLDIGRLREYDVLLTTYETMRDYHLSFARLAFDILIFDEVQKLKNPTSQVTHTAKTLNAEFVLSMTGTPVENKLHDVWSIMDVTWPGQLGASREFAQKYAESAVDDLRVLNDRLTKPSSNGHPPMMLRRMKKDILDGLPTKTVIKRRREMPAEQSGAYLDEVRRARSASGPGVMLKALQAWRSISVHPHPAPKFDPANVTETIAHSARFLETFDILREINSRNEKAIIFLENLEWQAWLSNAIRTQFGLRDNPRIINGSVPGNKRQEIVDRFQSEPDKFDVMILSPRAAGVGLTITAANNVIHLSRWWNPAVEDQATDRVYRIGQTKPVTVYIPQAIHPSLSISKSSFDEKLDELMTRKRQLSGSFLAPPDANSDELEEIFNDVISADFDQPAEVGVKDESQGAESSDVPRNGVDDTRSASASEGATIDSLPVGKFIPIDSVAAGSSRPIGIVMSALECGDLMEIWIEDPYFPCENVLEASAKFLNEVIYPKIGKPNKLRVRSLDPDHPKLRNQLQLLGKKAIQSNICERLGMPVQFRFERRNSKYFHDRSVLFILSTSFGVKNIRWNLPGGIEHWVDQGRPHSATMMVSEATARWT